MLALFVLTALAYGAATFAYGSAGAGVQDRGRRLPILVLAVAALFHTATIGAQCVEGDHPFRSVYLASSLGTLIAVVAVLTLSLRRSGLAPMGAMMAPLGLVGLTLSVVVGSAGHTAVPTTIMVRVHIACATLGLAGFSLAAAVAGLYLATERRLRTKQFRIEHAGGPSLAALERLHHRLVLAVVPVFTIGVVSGALSLSLATIDDRALEISAAAVAWIASVISLISRGVWGVRGRKAAWLIITAFACMIVIVVSYAIREGAP